MIYRPLAILLLVLTVPLAAQDTNPATSTLAWDYMTADLPLVDGGWKLCVDRLGPEGTAPPADAASPDSCPTLAAPTSTAPAGSPTQVFMATFPALTPGKHTLELYAVHLLPVAGAEVPGMILSDPGLLSVTIAVKPSAPQNFRVVMAEGRERERA